MITRMITWNFIYLYIFIAALRIYTYKIKNRIYIESTSLIKALIFMPPLSLYKFKQALIQTSVRTNAFNQIG